MQLVSNGIYKFSLWLISILVAIMVIVILLEVFGRSILGQSFPWSEEVARYSFIWLTFIGASAVYKRNEMVGFDILIKILSPKFQKISVIIIQLIVIAFSIVLLYFGSMQTFSRSVLVQHSAGLGIAMWIPYISIPLGMLMMLVHALSSLIQTIAEKRGEQL